MYYESLHEYLVNQEGSPYKDKGSLGLSEFLWALNVVSNRHIVLHDHEMDKDPNLLLMMMPLMDFLNHSISPNAGIFPHVERLENDHSYLVLKALRDIEADE